MDNIIKWFKEKMKIINDKMKAKTGIDINFGLILFGIIFTIIVIIIIKGVLGWVGSSLMG